MTGNDVTLDKLEAEIRKAGVAEYVEATGGGCSVPGCPTPRAFMFNGNPPVYLCDTHKEALFERMR